MGRVHRPPVGNKRRIRAVGTARSAASPGTGPYPVPVLPMPVRITEVMLESGGAMTVEDGAMDNGHILVVDDEADVRDLLEEYLGRQGFRVSTAADVPAARAVLEAPAAQTAPIGL